MLYFLKATTNIDFYYITKIKSFFTYGLHTIGYVYRNNAFTPFESAIWYIFYATWNLDMS